MIPALLFTITAGLVVLGIIEWHDDPPRDWVVKVRLWWHRRGR